MKYVLVLVALLVATSASAQTTVKNPFVGNFCYNMQDDSGVALPAGTVLQVQAKIDGTDQALVAMPAAGSSAISCPAGSSAYKVTGYTAAKGSHTFDIALVSADGAGLYSGVPFTFAVKGPVPGKVTNVTVSQQ